PGPCLRGMAAGAASDRLGLPRPDQAFALSHFRTPHEAPLIGQDGRTIKPRGSAGIGIHSQVRERRLADFRAPDAAQRHKRVYARLRRAMALAERCAAEPAPRLLTS